MKSCCSKSARLGYDSRQISDGTGSAARNAGVHAVGGQIGLTCLPWNAALNFHYFYGFASEDRFQGQSFIISLFQEVLNQKATTMKTTRRQNLLAAAIRAAADEKPYSGSKS